MEGVVQFVRMSSRIEFSPPWREISHISVAVSYRVGLPARHPIVSEELGWEFVLWRLNEAFKITETAGQLGLKSD